MDPIVTAKQKITAVLMLIEALKNSDYPYPDSKDALIAIEAMFKEQQESLETLGPDSDSKTVKAFCHQVYGALSDFLPFLGYIHHSRNPTNAFELYGPIL